MQVTIALHVLVHASKGRKRERKSYANKQAGEKKGMKGNKQGWSVGYRYRHTVQLTPSRLHLSKYCRPYSTAQDRAKRNPEADGYVLILVLFVQHIAVGCRRQGARKNASPSYGTVSRI